MGRGGGMRRRPVVIGVAAVSALVLGRSGIALASEETPGAGWSVNGDGFTVVASNTTRTGGSPGTGGGGGSAGGGGERRERAGRAAGSAPTGDVFPNPLNGTQCGGTVEGGRCPLPMEPFLPMAPGGEPAPAVDPRVVAIQALDSLALPVPQIRLNPVPPKDQLVNLATWMWLEPSSWGARSASASVPGVTVSVTAQPERTIWSLGNGDHVVCNGPGTPYDNTKPEAAQRSDCTYTYRRSSAGQPLERYIITATVEWSATWSVAGAPGGGTLPGIARSASVPVRVAEIQSLITDAG